MTNKKRRFYIIASLLVAVIVPITIYLGNVHNKASLEKRKIEINSAPVPVNGWVELKRLIKYPELFYRAGVDGHADVVFVIDSVGKIINMRVRASSSVFADTIRYYLRDLEWYPAKRKGKNIEDSIDCHIQFDSKDLGERFIIINGKE